MGETVHFGPYEPAARLAAAVNLLRLCELSGVPPSVATVAFFRNAVSAALLWVREDYPGLWAAFVLRFRGIGIDDYREPGFDRKQDAIQRAILDVLPLEHIKRLYDATMRELHRVANIVDGTRSFSFEMDRYEGIQAIRRLGDAATRFSMCLDHEDRERLFELFLRVSRADALSRSPILQDTLWNMAWRTVAYFSPGMINKWAKEIFIQFPPTTEETQRLRGWPEISEFVCNPRDGNFVRPTSPEFDEGVAGFIKLLSSSNLIDRTGAALRLLGMYDRGLLLEAECDAYRDGLWAVLDDDGLPKISQEVLRKIVHLQWPTDDETKVLDGLVSWISSHAVTDRFTRQDSEDGTGGVRYAVTYPDPDEYLNGLLGLYYRLAAERQAFDSVFSGAVRAHILATILEWWQRERDRFLRQRGAPLIFGDNVFQRLEVTLQVLFNCVLGSGVAEKDGDKLKGFLEELRPIRETGVYWSQVAAALEVIPVEEYWAQVRTEFWRNESQSADKALESCGQWIRRRETLALEPVPSDVFVTLMSEVANVRGEKCRQVCRLMAGLVERGYVHSEDVDLEFLKAAVSSAALQLNDEAVINATRVLPTEYREMCPHLRRELTRLMLAMEGRRIALDEIGEEWLNRRKVDRFVDVRALVGDREA